jgi:hypothetical protein
VGSTIVSGIFIPTKKNKQHIWRSVDG